MPHLIRVVDCEEMFFGVRRDSPRIWRTIRQIYQCWYGVSSGRLQRASIEVLRLGLFVRLSLLKSGTLSLRLPVQINQTRSGPLGITICDTFRAQPGRILALRLYRAGRGAGCRRTVRRRDSLT